MAFATPRLRQPWSGFVDTATWQLPLPALNADEFVVIQIIIINGGGWNSQTEAEAEGWAYEFNERLSTISRNIVIRKQVTGSETFVTLAGNTTGRNVQACIDVWQDWNAFAFSARETAQTTLIDPPLITPPWGAEDNAYVSTLMYCDDSGNLTATPAGYTSDVFFNEFDGNPNTTASIASRIKYANSASDDPGTWELDDSERCFAFGYVVQRGTKAPSGGGDTTAPTLSAPTDTDTGSTTGSGSVDTNEANGTLYWVTTTSATSPSVAQIQAGQDHTGAAAADSGSLTVTATGTQNVTMTGLTASTGYFNHYQHQDAAGNDSTVSSADGFTTQAGGDTTAPTLSNPTAVENSATSLAATVTTNEANGTLSWVATASATSPTAAQVKAGQDHTGASAVTSGSQSVSATGVQSVSVTGLTTGQTVYVHFQQDDAASNASVVVSSTAAAPYAETTALADDFDSAIGTATVVNPFTYQPTLVLTPYDDGDVPGWLNIYCRFEGVNGKRPIVSVDHTNFRQSVDPLDYKSHKYVWRETDDVTVPANGRPRSTTVFDNESGYPAFTTSNNSDFAFDNLEVMFKPRWRYRDTVRAVAYCEASGKAVELPSSVAASGMPKHVFAQVDDSDTKPNSTPTTLLNMYGLGLDDTSVSPAGGKDKLNVILIPGMHSSEDQGNMHAWEMAFFYAYGTGTLADSLRQNVRIWLYDVNPLGRFHGDERTTSEDTGNNDPNRVWPTDASTSPSEQVDNVIQAIDLDRAPYSDRVDAMFDSHGSYTLNRTSTNEFGYYHNGLADELSFISRLETLHNGGTTIANLGTAGTSWAIAYAANTLGTQIALVPENPPAADGYPNMLTMYSDYSQDMWQVLIDMIGSGEITQASLSTTVEASVGFGLQLGESVAAGATAESSVSEAAVLDGSFSTGLIVDALITSTIALADATSADAHAESDVVGALGLNSGFTGDVSAAGEIEGVVTFGLDLTGQATAEAQALAEIVASMELDSSATAEVSHEASVGFDLALSGAAQAEATAEAALLMTTELATAVVAEALTEANVQFATIHDVTFTGATVSASFTTPAGRTFKVLAETRVFKVSADK